MRTTVGEEREAQLLWPRFPFHAHRCQGIAGGSVCRIGLAMLQTQIGPSIQVVIGDLGTCRFDGAADASPQSLPRQSFTEQLGQDRAETDGALLDRCLFTDGLGSFLGIAETGQLPPKLFVAERRQWGRNRRGRCHLGSHVHRPL